MPTWTSASLSNIARHDSIFSMTWCSCHNYAHRLLLGRLQVLAVEVTNDGSADVGLLVSLVGASGVVVSDASWRCSNVYAEHWPDIGFDDSTWPAATEIGTYDVALPIHVSDISPFCIQWVDKHMMRWL